MASSPQDEPSSVTLLGLGGSMVSYFVYGLQNGVHKNVGICTSDSYGPLERKSNETSDQTCHFRKIQ
jgi:hypothetical protein